MNLRDSKTRLILIVVSLGAALVIAVASCSGGGDDDAPSDAGKAGSSETPGAGSEESKPPSEGDTPAEEQPDPMLGQVTGEESITLTFTRAEREEGGFLTLEGTIHNAGGQMWFDLAWAGTERELADNGFSMAGATLTAKSEGKRYLILRDTGGRCLCTGFGNGLAAGDTISWFAQFPEPEASTTEVDFQIGKLPATTLEIR